MHTQIRRPMEVALAHLDLVWMVEKVVQPESVSPPVVLPVVPVVELVVMPMKMMIHIQLVMVVVMVPMVVTTPLVIKAALVKVQLRESLEKQLVIYMLELEPVAVLR